MILLTGGTGLVGSHLLLHLIENGEEVCAIYRNPDSVEKAREIFIFYKKESLFDKVKWKKGDILDISSLEKIFKKNKIDFVYHCAALVSFDPKDERLIRKTNIEGTANIVNFCLAKNVEKLCYVSSIAALGDLKQSETLITEETEWNPEQSHSDYGISKYGAEMEVFRGQKEGLKTVIVNPGVILGPRIWEEGSGVFYKIIAKGFPFYFKGITGFVSVDDVVKVVSLLMKSEIENERFVLVANNLSYQEFFNNIAEALKVKKSSVFVSPFWVGVFWRLDWFVSTFFRTKRLLDRETARASFSKNQYSNEKIKKALVFDFKDVNEYLNEVLKK